MQLPHFHLLKSCTTINWWQRPPVTYFLTHGGLVKHWQGQRMALGLQLSSFLVGDKFYLPAFSSPEDYPCGPHSISPPILDPGESPALWLCIWTYFCIFDDPQHLTLQKQFLHYSLFQFEISAMKTLFTFLSSHFWMFLTVSCSLFTPLCALCNLYLLFIYILIVMRMKNTD